MATTGEQISINTLCLEPTPFADQVSTVEELGASLISPTIGDVESCGAEEAARIVGDSGLDVALLTHMAFGFSTAAEADAARSQLDRSIEAAYTIGSPAICMITGGRGDLAWPDACKRFADEIAPCAERARQAGVVLGLEPTTHLYADMSIAHRLSDVVTLAQAAGIGVGIDIFACWVDADIDEAIDAAAPMTSFVQVSDYVYGDRSIPCRAVLGDGAVPLERLLTRIRQVGFRGPFDIEVIGPRLDAEGRAAGLRRCVAELRRILAVDPAS